MISLKFDTDSVISNPRYLELFFVSALRVRGSEVLLGIQNNGRKRTFYRGFSYKIVFCPSSWFILKQLDNSGSLSNSVVK